MKKQLALSCLLAAAPAAATLPASDSPAYQQAAQLTPLTSEYVYDNMPLRAASLPTPMDAPGAASERCPAGNCDLRRGGPPPSMNEPRNPITALQKEDKEKKDKAESGGINWKSPMVMAGAGAVVGGLVGYFAKGSVLGFALKGGLMGGLIGAAIGALIGFMLSKYLS